MLFSIFILITVLTVIPTNGVSSSICPPVEDISPCSCSVSTVFNLYMDCSHVTSELELARIFNQPFPSTEFRALDITHNKYIKTLREGVFGNTSFQEIHINDVVMQEVEPGALLSSSATLKTLQLEHSNVSLFPFDEIAFYNRLKYLYLSNDSFLEFPKMVSTSLRELDFSRNPIVSLEADVLQGIPVIENIYLFSCNISRIQTGTFTGLNHLHYLTLADNDITYLPPYAFELHGHNARLFLTTNKIAAAANNSVSGVSYFMNMAHNNLQLLEEGVWRPILEEGPLVSFENNPLTCGCDLAWLVRDDILKKLIFRDSKCIDGTLIVDLDPKDFEIC